MLSFHNIPLILTISISPHSFMAMGYSSQETLPQFTEPQLTEPQLMGSLPVHNNWLASIPVFAEAVVGVSNGRVHIQV